MIMGCGNSKLQDLSHSDTFSCDLSPFKLVHTASIDEWREQIATRWRFDVNIDMTSKKTRLQPWCTGGRS